jgi:hypothetical protein
MVKRILRMHKCPPDQQDAAVELVLQQTKALGEAWRCWAAELLPLRVTGLGSPRHLHSTPGCLVKQP